MSDKIQTAEELDALPVGSVLGYVGGAAHRQYAANAKALWSATNGGHYWSAVALARAFGRLTILWRPDELMGGVIPIPAEARDVLRDRIEEELSLGGDASTLVVTVTNWLAETEGNRRSDAARLRSGIEALADEWEGEATCPPDADYDCVGCNVRRDLAGRLRALLSADDESLTPGARLMQRGLDEMRERVAADYEKETRA